MTSLSEAANAHEPKKTLNIADLEVIRTDAQIFKKRGKGDDGEDFVMNVITIDGMDYRVPDSVLTALKAILAKNPKLQTFSVSKTGQGMNTRYAVVPIM